MKTEIERRAFDLTSLEVRAKKGEPKKIVGYAAVFDSLSEPMYGFRERIQRGAFAESVQADDIRALWNHNADHVLGRNRAGTLRLQEDDRGLRIEITPPGAEWARGLMESIERGDVSQMSFGFQKQVDSWDETDPSNIIRTLVKVKLFDVSPVTYPAYPETSVNVRTAEEIMNEHIASAGRPRATDDQFARIAQESESRERDLQLVEKGY